MPPDDAVPPDDAAVPGAATGPDGGQGGRRAARPAKPERVAVVIPAKDEAARIEATVRAARTIPAADLVVVVDDGSRDRTGDLADDAGALVVRHPRNRGKAAAMETGADFVATQERAPGPFATGTPRALLFVDADLGGSAAATGSLTEPVLSGDADMTVAVLPPQATPGGGRGLVVNLARRGIAEATGWQATQPLSGMRCLTRPAFEAARPLARGWGVETALTIDLLLSGFRLQEVPCALHHRVTGTDLRAQLHRAKQYRDVWLALLSRRLRRAGPLRRMAVRRLRQIGELRGRRPGG